MAQYQTRGSGNCPAAHKDEEVESKHMPVPSPYSGLAQPMPIGFGGCASSHLTPGRAGATTRIRWPHLAPPPLCL